VMLGAVEAVVTVNVMPLLATPPTVTTTSPVVAPVGTGATMFVAPQLVGMAAVPLNLTVLYPWAAPKFAPWIVTEVPTGPEVGLTLEMLGAPPVDLPYPLHPTAIGTSAMTRIDNTACRTVPRRFSILIADILIPVLCNHI